jgi:FkbM family methyltransferase
LATNASSGRSAARSIASALWLLFRQRFTGAGGASVEIEVTRDGHAFRFRVQDTSEIFGLAGVLIEEQYALPRNIKPLTILDFGSNVGSSIAYFRRRFPDAVIHGFEPDPRTFETLKANVGHLPRVHLHQVAVGREDGTATFYTSPRSWASSLQRNFPDQRPVDVEVRTLGTVLQEIGIQHADLVKLDVEGAEIAALEAFPERTERINVFVGEMHEELAGLGDEQQLLTQLFAGWQLTFAVRGRDRLFLARAPDHETVRT